MNLEQALARIAELEAHNKADRVHWKHAELNTAGLAFNLLTDDAIPMLGIAISAIKKGRLDAAQNYLERLLSKCEASVGAFDRSIKKGK